ncbi:MAG: glycosyltransferase family 4 protein [Desulfobacterales bacterium]
MLSAHQTPNTEHQTLNIYFYAPFKPLGHDRPSGDLVIGSGLYDYLAARGHRLRVATSLRSRWIFWKPWMVPRVLTERRRLLRRLGADTPDLWLTYHAYFKGPDVIGPWVAARAGVPYVIFQGAYATKRRRDLKSLAGFWLNRRALRVARHVFVNKRVDYLNMRRLLPPERVSYVSPGILPRDFSFSETARRDLRRKWRVAETPVVLTAAMFRPGVKYRGLAGVIEACGRLRRNGLDFRLVIVGDGRQRSRLVRLAQTELPGKVLFAGQVPRTEMVRFYSAGDLFVFPGIGESLGMVYLEAQSCGLPVVAVDNAGVPEAVADGITGVLVPPDNMDAFTEAIADLVADTGRRQTMGRAARAYIRQNHDLTTNYLAVEMVLNRIAGGVRTDGHSGGRTKR